MAWGFVIGVVIGVGMDIGVMVTKRHLVVVSNDYMGIVYTTICSIAVLSYSIFSLISGIFEKRYYGFRLKEILLFIRKEVNLKRYIIGSLLLVGLSTLVFMLDKRFNTVNTLTMLMISLLISELKMSIAIFDILSNDEICYSAVFEYFSSIKNSEMNEKQYMFILDNLCIALDEVKDSTNSRQYEKLFDLFQKLIACNPEYALLVYQQLNIRVSEIAFNLGYGKLVELVVGLNDGRENYLELLEIPLREMKFYEETKFVKSKYLRSIIEIPLFKVYQTKKIADETIARLLLIYFESLMKNRIICKKTRDNAISDFFFEICNWDIWNDNENLQPNERVLCFLIRKYILSNEEKYNRTKLMEAFFKGMLKKRFCNYEHFYNFLSQICEAFYFYTYKECLTDSARKKIYKLFQHNLKTQEIESVTFSFLIEENIEGIMKALGNRIRTRKEYSYQILEYNPKYSNVKTAVWTVTAEIEFAFLLYNVYWERLCLYSFWKLCFGSTEIENGRKDIIINTLMNLFNMDEEIYSVSFMKEYDEARDFFNIQFRISEEVEKRNFNIFNEKKKKLNGISNMDKESLPNDVEGLQKRFDEYINKNVIFGVCQAENMEPYIRYSIQPFVNKRESDTLIIHELYSGAVQSINDFIKNNSAALEVSFGIEGIKKMNEFLNDENYNSRNYTYIDDQALEEYQSEATFQELTGKIKKMKMVRTPNLHSYIFFKKEKLKFRIHLLKFDSEPLKTAECEDYIKNYRTSNGMYNLEGALYTRDESINFIKEKYNMVKMEFKLFYLLGKNDVVRIIFKRGK